MLPVVTLWCSLTLLSLSACHAQVVLPSFGETFHPFDESLRLSMIEKCDLTAKSRPVTKGGQPVTVLLEMMPYNFREIHDRDETFTVTAELELAWRHPCVNWQNSTEFADVTYFEIAAADTFYPKLNQLNAVTDISFCTKSAHEKDIYVESDGYFYLNIANSFHSYCQLSLRQFPFDKQTCDLHFQAYYDVRTTVFELLDGDGIDHSTDLGTFVSPGEVWQLTGIRGAIRRANYSGYVYHQPVFSFSFRRRSAVYVITLFFPNFCLSIMLVGSGLMPPKHPDRPTFCATVVLAYGVSQATISQALPLSSELIYAILFMTFQLSISVVVTLYALVTCEMARRPAFKRRINIPHYVGETISLIRIIDILFYNTTALVILIINGAIFGLMRAE